VISTSPSWAVAGIALAALVALGAAACGDDDGGGSQHAEAISAITILDKAGLHDIDEAINEDKEVPPTARTTALHMQALVNLTDWPGDFDDDARALEKTFADLAASLDSDNPDLGKAGTLAKQAHDQEHELSHNLWAWLQDEAGIEASGGDAEE
jgi:hypothetical protein